MSHIPPSGPQVETDTRGNGPRLSGVYKHPVNGTEFIAIGTVDLGNPQADAAVRLGFVYDRPVEDGEIKERILDYKGEEVNVGTNDEASQLRDQVAALQAELADANKAKAVKSAPKKATPKKDAKKK